MKRVFSILPLLLCMAFSLCAAVKNIEFRAEYFPPFVCGMNSKSPGFAIEVLRAVFPEKEYRLTFHYHGWQWAMRDLQQNRIQAYIGVSKADYPNFAMPNLPLFRTRSAVYLKKGVNLQYDNPESLAKLKTGFLPDYSHSDEFDAFQEKHAKDGAVVYYTGWNASDKMVRDVMANKIQAVVNNTAQMNWTFRRVRKSENALRLVQKLSNYADFYVAFSPGRKESWSHIGRFNREFPKFKKTPEYRKLLQKYGLKEDDFQ